MDHCILLVDDEPNVLSALQRALMDEPYEILTATSGELGLEALEHKQVRVIVSDERMPGMGGAEFLSQVKERYPAIIRIMLTGHASIESTMKAVNSGEIYRFFTKPWNDAEIVLALRSAVEKYELEEENRRLLKTVVRQSQELKDMERRFPGITEVERDATGCFVMPELSEDEIAQIIATYCDE